jgi:Xaa-Pro aminopeptidase
LLGLQQVRRSATFAALTRALPMLRAIKDDEELRRMSGAAAAADAACRELLGVRFAGRSERELASDLSHILRRNGYDRVEPSVVASGPHSAQVQHSNSGRVLAEGDVVVIRFGGTKDGYAGTLTRTVYVGQTPPEEVRTVHGLVRRAFEAALLAIRPGTECQEVDRVMRHVLIQGGYRDHMPPLTGHGIGLAVKEPPILADGETLTLRAGMCLTLSPGVVVPGRFGIRLQDIIVVTHDGAARLTRTTPLLTPTF